MNSSSQNIFIHVLIFCAVSFGVGLVRQNLPKGITWRDTWAKAEVSAEEGYKAVARPDDAPFISLADVKKVYEERESFFIDARSSKEFAEGHIPGSRNLPFYEMDAYGEQALAGATAETPLIVYCEGVGCELSFFLSRELQKSGYKNIRIFYGGYPEWKDSGMPVDKK